MLLQRAQTHKEDVEQDIKPEHYPKVGSHRRRASVIGDILARPSGASSQGLQGLQLTGRADVGCAASADSWLVWGEFSLLFECNLGFNLNRSTERGEAK